MTATRRLAAILAVDVVGYSRLMFEDEAGRRGCYTSLASVQADSDRPPSPRPLHPLPRPAP